MKDRKRRPGRLVQKCDLCESVGMAQDVLADELTKRMFGTSPDCRPSESRLVQIYMSKQMPAETVLPEALLPTARAHYVKWLRQSSTLVNRSTTEPPNKKVAKVGTPLFRSHNIQNRSHSNQNANCTSSEDAVQSEIDQWAALSTVEIERHRDERGLLDEFALMSAMRLRFPIHCNVFMRTTSHYAHEADCESFFSIVKAVSDPNMFPSMLRVLSKVGYNTKSYKPG